MSNKTIILIILVIFVFIGGKYAWDMLFANSEIVSFDDSDWSQKNILGVKFESPFELSETKTDIPNSQKEIIKGFNKFQYKAETITMLIKLIEFKDGAPNDLNRIYEQVELLRATRGVYAFNYEVKPIDNNSFTGRLVQGTCKMNGKEAEFSGECYKKDSKQIQIFCIYLNHKENREVRERIMKSINVTF
jgi:hypothetical protein